MFNKKSRVSVFSKMIPQNIPPSYLGNGSESHGRFFTVNNKISAVSYEISAVSNLFSAVSYKSLCTVREIC